MCDHLERYAQFTCIDHTSPMVKGLHYEDAQVGRSSERSLASIYLNHLDVNPIFQKLEENERLLAIKS